MTHKLTGRIIRSRGIKWSGLVNFDRFEHVKIQGAGKVINILGWSGRFKHASVEFMRSSGLVRGVSALLFRMMKSVKIFFGIIGRVILTSNREYVRIYLIFGFRVLSLAVVRLSLCLFVCLCVCLWHLRSRTENCFKLWFICLKECVSDIWCPSPLKNGFIFWVNLTCFFLQTCVSGYHSSRAGIFFYNEK